MLKVGLLATGTCEPGQDGNRAALSKLTCVPGNYLAGANCPGNAGFVKIEDWMRGHYLFRGCGGFSFHHTGNSGISISGMSGISESSEPSEPSGRSVSNPSGKSADISVGNSGSSNSADSSSPS